MMLIPGSCLVVSVGCVIGLTIILDAWCRQHWCIPCVEMGWKQIQYLCAPFFYIIFLFHPFVPFLQPQKPAYLFPLGRVLFSLIQFVSSFPPNRARIAIFDYFSRSKKKVHEKNTKVPRVYFIKISSGRNGLNETPILSNTTIVSFLFIYHFWVLSIFLCSLSICALPCCWMLKMSFTCFLYWRVMDIIRTFFTSFSFSFFLAWGKSTRIHRRRTHTHSLAFSLSPRR